jgi:hypothetical protein
MPGDPEHPFMNVFHCDHCANLIFFENVRCVACDHTLAYLPDLGVVGSLDPVAGTDTWTSPLPRAKGRTYRLCANSAAHGVCNWAVPAADPHPLCESCRLTRVIPDLNVPGNKEAWQKLEVAKRRLVYTLLKLGCPVQSKIDDPERGLAFEFLADRPDGTKALTGHADGVITVNVTEADDAERERRRIQLYEPYRTLLGHFRHESAHYYWDRLIAGTKWLGPFREWFGDERADYGSALQAHYAAGPPADWPERFVSSYAAAHPWEDWAETWAHYLHMTDTLETAADCGLSLRPRREGAPTLKAVVRPDSRRATFDRLIDAWFPLTYALNNLNRGLGLPDGYPFVLSAAAIDKLRFVHDLLAGGGAMPPSA